jgi:hypothetical protein
MSSFSSRSARVRAVFLGAAAVTAIIATSSGAAFAGGSRPKPPPPPPPTTVPVTTTTAVRDQSPPTVPTNFRPFVIPYRIPDPHQLDIQWDQSTDNIDVSSNLDYRVYLNGVSQGLVCAGTPYCFGESSFRFSNLVPGATYRLSVEAIDRSGNISARSADYVFVGV